MGIYWLIVHNRNIYISPYIIIYHRVIKWKMTKIQIDLDMEEDKIVEIYKLVNNLKTKQEAIKKMVRYFKAEIKPKNLKEKEYFK